MIKTPPTGGLCQEPGTDPELWTVQHYGPPGFRRLQGDVCHGCDVILECRRYIAGTPVLGIIIGGWAASGHIAQIPPWNSEGYGYPLPQSAFDRKVEKFDHGHELRLASK